MGLCTGRRNDRTKKNKMTTPSRLTPEEEKRIRSQIAIGGASSVHAETIAEIDYLRAELKKANTPEYWSDEDENVCKDESEIFALVKGSSVYDDGDVLTFYAFRELPMTKNYRVVTRNGEKTLEEI
jgi:hypothetical protein